MVSKPKFMKCFLTNVLASKREIEIWCQSDSSLGSRVESALDSSHKHLSDLFAVTSQRLMDVPEPEVGQYYLTHMPNDLHFYRVVVTDVRPDSGEALVSFMDFGNEELVPFNHLVVMDELFDVRPLAQKFFLADILPKDKAKGWDLESVRLALTPFLFTSFMCEVIEVTRNTECIRVYDFGFNQPLIQKLVQKCNAVLEINCETEAQKAMDLSIDSKRRRKEIEENIPKLSSESIASTPVPSPRSAGFATVKQEDIEDKENRDIEIEDKTSGTNSSFETTVSDNVPKDYRNDEEMEDLNKSFVDKTDLKSTTEDATEPMNQSFGGDSNEPNGEVIVKSADNKVDECSEALNSEAKEESLAPNEDSCGIANVCLKKEVVENGTEEPNVATDEPKSENKTEETDSAATNETKIEASVESAPQMNGTIESPKTTTCELVFPVAGDSERMVGTVQLYVTASDSDQSFYCQFVHHFNDITALCEEMTEYYNSIMMSGQHSLALSDLKERDIIAARFTNDSQWYRASVKAVSKKDLDVFYLDYGNRETINVVNCRALLDKYKKTSPQAMHCSPAHPISKDKLKTYELDMTELKCQVVSADNDSFKIRILSDK